MSFKKTLTALLALFVLVFGLAAPGTASAALSYTKSGAKYIYSNNPESIYSDQTTGRYTTYTSLSGGQEYVSEFYHHNYMGQNMRVGVAIKNHNTYTVNVTVMNKAVLAGTWMETSTSALRDYGNSTNYQTISIPAGQTVTIAYGDALQNQIINGKVKFKPQYGNMTARVFFVATGNYNVNNIFNYAQATKTATTGGETTSGVFAYDTRNVTINASTTPNFYLSAYEWIEGYNEYEVGSNVLGSSKLLGNFGIVYDLTITNAAGKYIKITPNLTSSGANAAQLVLYTNANKWYRTSKLLRTSGPTYWTMAVPSDGKVKYTLPGGNFGSVRFDIVSSI